MQKLTIDLSVQDNGFVEVSSDYEFDGLNGAFGLLGIALGSIIEDISDDVGIEPNKLLMMSALDIVTIAAKTFDIEKNDSEEEELMEDEDIFEGFLEELTKSLLRDREE